MWNVTVIAATALTVLIAGQSYGMSAKEVMRRSNKTGLGKTSIATTLMMVMDADGTKTTKTMKVYKKKFSGQTKSLTQFLAPADIRNTSYLNFDFNNDSRQDDSWLYLPSLRKTKRIVGSDKSRPFMDSDFSYADINGMELEDWDYKFVSKSDPVDGYDCWQIQATPKRGKKSRVIESTGYRKTMVWVRKDNFIPVKGKYWVAGSRKIKFMTVSKLKKIQGIWTAMETQMVTTKGGRKMLHSTLNQVKSIRYNTKIKNNQFTKVSMEAGI